MQVIKKWIESGEKPCNVDMRPSSFLSRRVHITKETYHCLNEKFEVEPGNGHQRDNYLADHKVETFLIIPPIVSLKTLPFYCCLKLISDFSLLEMGIRIYRVQTVKGTDSNLQKIRRMDNPNSVSRLDETGPHQK